MEWNRYHHSEVDNKIPWYWQWMDVYLSICKENLSQRHDRRYRYAYMSLYCIEIIQAGMMVDLFNGNSSTTIISGYSPTNVSDEIDLNPFYNELSSFVRSITKHKILIFGRDMNVLIGKNVNNKFRLHNLSNRNGEHLMDFTLENRLKCLNFRKERKLLTDTYANNAKAQIDLTLMNKKLINSTLNYEVYSSFEAMSTDHQIVMAKIHLSLHRNPARTTKFTQYDWSLLNNRDISDRYMITQRNKFDELEKISETLTPNYEYENFVNAYIEVSAECIPNKLRGKYRVPWKTLAVKKSRNDVKTASLCNRRNPTNTLTLRNIRRHWVY